MKFRSTLVEGGAPFVNSLRKLIGAGKTEYGRGRYAMYFAGKDPEARKSALQALTSHLGHPHENDHGWAWDTSEGKVVLSKPFDAGSYNLVWFVPKTLPGGTK